MKLFLVTLFTVALMSLGRIGACAATPGETWHVVRVNAQKHFNKVVPSAGYSGIARLSGDVYGLVDDRADSALLTCVRLYISRQTGELLSAEYVGPRGSTDAPGLDNESVVRITDSTVVVASEARCRLREYALDGDARRRNLWQWSMAKGDFWDNYSFESLAFDSIRSRLWTISEAPLRRDGSPASPQNVRKNVLRLMAFDWQRRDTVPTSWLYRMDQPSTMRTAENYAMGVSEMCALPDGQLLVLEREAFVPKVKVGAFCQCKLYVVNPLAAKPFAISDEVGADAPYLEKRLLTSWRTKLTLLDQTWANYEGMCLGPQLDNGDQVLVLVSDSQSGYAGVLRDWFKTIVLSNK